jgi:hypothetical protein
MTHAHFIIMGGFTVKDSLGQRRRVSADAFVQLTANGYIKLRSDLEAEILDKSKASSLAKLVACIQIAWFLAQLLERGIEKLPTSVLEMFTLSVVICSLISYGFWWRKPLDVRIPIVRETSGGAEIDQFLEPLERQKSIPAANPKYTPERRWNLVPLYFQPFGRSLSACTITIVPVFATCHLVAWNWSFPSRVEQILWRISSVGCLVLPAMFSLAAWAPFDWCRKRRAIIPLIGLYALLRSCMVAEIFAALRSMPDGVYTRVHLPLPHF